MDATSAATFPSYGPGKIGISVSVRRLTLVIDLPTHLSDLMLANLQDCVGDPSFLSAAGLHRVVGAQLQGYKLGLAGHVLIKKGRPRRWSPNPGFFIRVAPKKAIDPTVRLDIEPECAKQKGFAHMRDTLGKLSFPWPEFCDLVVPRSIKDCLQIPDSDFLAFE